MECFRTIVGAAALFLLLTAQAFFLLSRCKLRFELAVPICLMSDMFFLLFSGILFSNLLIGICLIIGFSMTGILATFWGERKHLRDFFKVFCSAGFIVFIVGYVFSWVVSVSQVPHAWDDYGHWLPFVKQMVTYNKLYSEPDVYLMKQWYYTPAVSLLQYFSCVLIGEFSECACYAMGTLLMFVSVLPIMKWFEPKSGKVRAFTTLVVFLSLYIAAGEDLDGFFLGFRSSYVDIHLSAVSALLLLVIVFEKNSFSKTVYVGIVSAFLTMMKVTGVMFALLGAGTYFLVSFITVMQRKVKKQKNIKILLSIGKEKKQYMQVLFALFPIGITILIYIMWNMQTRPEIEYGSIIGITSRGVVMSLNKYGQGLTLREFDLTWEWLRTYFYYFFTKPINDGAILPISSSVIVVLFSYAIYFKIKLHKAQSDYISGLIVLGICVVGGLFVYLLALGISFYSFSENLETMTSYKRYLSSYIGIIIVFVFVIWLHILFLDVKLNRNGRVFSIMLTLVFMTVIMPIEFIPAILGRSDNEEYKAYYNKMAVWGGVINDYCIGDSSEDMKAFLIKTGHGGLDTPSLAADVAMPGYFMLPIKLQDFSQYRYDPDSSLPFYTKEEWSELLLDYKFSNVVIANYSIPSLNWGESFVSENFSEFYSLFDMPPEELSFDAPLLFEIYLDDEEHVRLRQVFVERLIE